MQRMININEQDYLNESDSSVRLEDVILSKNNKELVDLIIAEQAFKDTFKSYGLKPINRFLFSGASGCGKTMLSNALANALNKTMFSIDIAKALNSGNSATQIADIFYIAKEKENCVIFLDECDSVVWNREAVSDTDATAIRKTTNAILQQIDRMNDYTTIFIAATNMSHKLDVAFKRRIDLHMTFTNPDEDYISIINKFLKTGFSVENDLTDNYRLYVEERARIAGLSYGELQVLLEMEMKESIMYRRGFTLLTSKIYKKIIDKYKIQMRYED